MKGLKSLVLNLLGIWQLMHFSLLNNQHLELVEGGYRLGKNFHAKIVDIFGYITLA